MSPIELAAQGTPGTSCNVNSGLWTELYQEIYDEIEQKAVNQGVNITPETTKLLKTEASRRFMTHYTADVRSIVKEWSGAKEIDNPDTMLVSGQNILARNGNTYESVEELFITKRRKKGTEDPDESATIRSAIKEILSSDNADIYFPVHNTNDDGSDSIRYVAHWKREGNVVRTSMINVVGDGPDKSLDDVRRIVSGALTQSRATIMNRRAFVYAVHDLPVPDKVMGVTREIQHQPGALPNVAPTPKQPAETVSDPVASPKMMTADNSRETAFPVRHLSPEKISGEIPVTQGLEGVLPVILVSRISQLAGSDISFPAPDAVKIPHENGIPIISALIERFSGKNRPTDAEMTESGPVVPGNPVTGDMFRPDNSRIPGPDSFFSTGFMEAVRDKVPVLSGGELTGLVRVTETIEPAAVHVGVLILVLDAVSRTAPEPAFEPEDVMIPAEKNTGEMSEGSDYPAMVKPDPEIPAEPQLLIALVVRALAAETPPDGSGTHATDSVPSETGNAKEPPEISGEPDPERESVPIVPEVIGIIGEIAGREDVGEALKNESDTGKALWLLGAAVAVILKRPPDRIAPAADVLPGEGGVGKISSDKIPEARGPEVTNEPEPQSGEKQAILSLIFSVVVVWLLTKDSDRNILTGKEVGSDADRVRTENGLKETLLSRPYLLLSIIRYLSLIRESGFMQSSPVVKKKKKRFPNKKTAGVSGTGVIYEYQDNWLKPGAVKREIMVQYQL